MNARQETQQRIMVAKLSREDLEDQYLRILEDNHILKAHGRKQEEKIKKMATKLLRLVSDRKKLAAQGGGRRTAREVDLEETIENQQETIRQLNKENDSIKQRLQVATQQLASQGRRQTPYSRVQARVDSGVPKKFNETQDRQYSRKQTGDRMSTRTSSPPAPYQRYGHSLLEEARHENHRLHQQILALHEQIARTEEDNQALKREINRINDSHETEMLSLRQRVNTSQKSTLGDNIELIKLQRQMKDRSSEVTTMEVRFQELQANYGRLRKSYDDVIHEMERLKTQLTQEESRNMSLQNSIKHGSSHQQTILQLQEQIRDLSQEVSILKDANDKLTHSAFDQEKEQQWRSLERKLRIQIAQLEAAIKADMSEKHNIMDKITNDREYASRIHSDSRKAYGDLDRVRRENQDLRERLKLYTSADDSVDIDELREALAMVRKKRHDAAQRRCPDFLEKIDDGGPRDLEAEFVELQTQNAETIQELDKTREMLLMQHKINKDYQIEVESVTNRMVEMKREYEAKLDRFARLLDARAARNKKLEMQLHDVAYGTKQFKIQQDKDESDLDESLDETIQLERGENLLEINVSKVTLSQEAIENLNDHDPSLFVTYAFFDYELVSTPILKNSSPAFDFTAQFTVKVDDLFLHHLQKTATLFELHQAMGIEHRTIASCKVRFNQLLDTPQGKLHGSATLTGMNGSNYGNLDFWIRLRVPMDQAIRLYRERTKALGYLSANTAATQKTFDMLNSNMNDTVDDTNQLIIQIVSCNHVEGRRKGTQPNIYCAYKFFDFTDHVTTIIPCTNNPHFDDRKIYPIQMDADLDAYLRSKKLAIYVFDDTDPDMMSFLGKAEIDLLPLAHDKMIKAPFQLTRSDNTENGIIEISARWHLSYKPPSGVLKDEGSHEDEIEIRDAEKLVHKPPVTPKKRQNVATKLSQPFASSTPKPVKRDEKVKPILQKQLDSIVNYEEEPEKEKIHDEPEEHDEDVTEVFGSFKSKSEPVLVAERQPLPVKRDKSLRFSDLESSEYTSIRPKGKTGKKVSILEPVKDRPVPLTRSIKKDHTKPQLDEDAIESMESAIPETGDDDAETSPKLPYIKSIDEEDDSPLPETTTASETEEDNKNGSSSPIAGDKEDVSETGSFDSTGFTSTKAKDETEEPSDTKELEDDDEPSEIKFEEEEDDDEEEEDDDEEEEDDEKEEDEEDEGSDLEEIIEEIPDNTVEEDEGETEEEKSGTDVKEDTTDVNEETTDVNEETTERQNSDTIQISINHLTLDPNTSVWGDTEVEKLFVEFDFLGSIEETPDAVMKPKNKDEKLIYNFEKSINVDSVNHSEQRQLLSSMMTSEHTSFKMTVVSEPNNDDIEECEEIGTASVDLATILENGRDIIGDDVVVEDLRNPSVVGKLNITVKALDVLKMIKKELNVRLQESES